MRTFATENVLCLDGGECFFFYFSPHKKWSMGNANKKSWSSLWQLISTSSPSLECNDISIFHQQLCINTESLDQDGEKFQKTAFKPSKRLALFCTGNKRSSCRYFHHVQFFSTSLRTLIRRSMSWILPIISRKLTSSIRPLWRYDYVYGYDWKFNSRLLLRDDTY